VALGRERSAERIQRALARLREEGISSQPEDSSLQG
jgi:hypothetical protein